MPVGAFVGALPPLVFLLLHLFAFVAAGYFAFRAFGADRGALGWAFTLFALGELLYAGASLDLFVLLFAHLLAALFDVAALFLVFSATLRRDASG